MSYNLLDQHWIPVLYRDGRWDRVGIRKALKDAGQIRQIAATNPMDRVAILRFLLALLYWCKGNPPDEGVGTSPDGFPPEWFSKLTDNSECFNLLGDGKRFYQDSNTRRAQAVTHLIQEIPSGNNFWHFKHSTDNNDGLCSACCATGLLRLPLFSVSGLSGPGEPNLMAGINGVPPIYVMLWGKTLKETLLANWTSCSSLGEPSWVDPNSHKEVPLLVGLTLLSRRVLLHDPDGPAGACIGCGSHEKALIRTIEFQTAGKQENDRWDDPHVVYIEGEKRKALRAEDLTRAGEFRTDRPWADLLARIVETPKAGLLLIVGFATNKAKNIDVWERVVAASQNQGISAFLQRWQKEGSILARRVRPPDEKKSSRKYVEIAAALSVIRPDIEDKVSARAGELVAGGADTWQGAADEYRTLMKVISKSLAPGFTTTALQRRQQIARAAPDMRARPQKGEKRNRTKGGDK